MEQFAKRKRSDDTEKASKLPCPSALVEEDQSLRLVVVFIYLKGHYFLGADLGKLYRDAKDENNMLI